jgi:hypothetical protein
MDLNETIIDPERYPLFYVYRALAFPVEDIAACSRLSEHELSALPAASDQKLPGHFGAQHDAAQTAWARQLIEDASHPGQKPYLGDAELNYYEKLLFTAGWLLDAFEEKYAKNARAFPPWVRAQSRRREFGAGPEL